MEWSSKVPKPGCHRPSQPLMSSQPMRLIQLLPELRKKGCVFPILWDIPTEDILSKEAKHQNMFCCFFFSGHQPWVSTCSIFFCYINMGLFKTRAPHTHITHKHRIIHHHDSFPVKTDFLFKDSSTMFRLPSIRRRLHRSTESRRLDLIVMFYQLQLLLTWRKSQDFIMAKRRILHWEQLMHLRFVGFKK